jgi:hypothetical protein
MTATLWRSVVTGAMALTLLFAGAVGSQAAPVGILNIAGEVSVTATTIDFLPPMPAAGEFMVLPFTTTGDFTGIATNPPPQGRIKDLDVMAQPVGTPFLLPEWITFTGPVGANYVFDLTFIRPGTFGSAQCLAPPAPGQTCTPDVPGGSQFNLANFTASASFVSFVVEGWARTTSDAAGTGLPFIGTFSTQFTDRSYQELLQTVLPPPGGQGGAISASYSANFLVIPEPGTMSLLLGGLLVGAGAVVRRRYAKK